jgi:c(7)-type cytochrome triheme protein
VRAIRGSGVAVVLGFACGLFLLSSSAAQVKSPPDFTFTQGKGSPAAVTFSHAKHTANNPCSSCHVKVFKMKKGSAGDITMAKMKEPQFCGACHNGKTEVGGKVVFPTDDMANCQRCHSNK